MDFDNVVTCMFLTLMFLHVKMFLCLIIKMLKGTNMQYNPYFEPYFQDAPEYHGDEHLHDGEYWYSQDLMDEMDDTDDND